MLCHVVRVEAREIPDIETAQHPSLGRGKYEMVLIRAFDHRRVEGGLHVNTTGAERSDQRLPQGIFVKVKA
jgi:hypothetical protein